MGRLDRLRDAKRTIQRAATERYIARTGERQQNKATVAEQGPGAADSTERQDNYRKRLDGMKSLRTMASRGQLPFGIERKMGASLDWIGLAPSDVARKAGRSVARIVAFPGDQVELEGFATGFLVAPDLLMTNWHVFPARFDAVNCAANFLYERTERGLERGILFELDPARFYVSDPKLDFAVVAVKPKSLRGEVLADLGQNTLIEATPKILKGQPINIIQYPQGREKRYAISENRLVDILEADGFLQYETDTAEGSSGSPAFSSDWELVALHHAAIPQLRDGRVVAKDGSFWTEEMGDDHVHWIANEGSRVSAIVARLTSLKLENPAEQAILAGLLATTTDPVAEAINAMGPTSVLERVSSKITGGSDVSTILNTRGDAMSGVQFTFTGPVTININTAAPPTEAATVIEPASRPRPDIIAVERSIRFDPDYAHRGGYDPSFLHADGKIVVPVPGIHPDRQGDILNREDGTPLVLKYHHFELVMNRKRRLQAWSAVNIDYAPTRKSSKNRDDWGRDRWIPDPRIPADTQIFDADFYKPAGNIDRGHIVRREDNEWGDSDLEIEFANSDTFHWTNCTPQHEAFNQSTPGRNDNAYRGMEGIWGAFENLIQQSRKDGDTKACILAGPILTDDDPTANFGLGPIQYPLRFWKIVCVAEGTEQSGLKVFGFILSQQDVVERFGIERFGPGKFKRYQVPLGDIAAAAKLEFDQRLYDGDTMAGQALTEIADARTIRGL